MTTIAIIGAGPGLGAAVARRFGAEGFAVGLISRNQERVDGLAAQLVGDGVEAKGFAANVRRPEGLARALESVTETLGPIEVLQYSPLPQKDFMRPIMGENRGTILFVNGGTALVPRAHLTGTSIAFAGETAYAQLLHETLGEEGIHVSQLVVGGSIVAGDKEKDPEILAGILWDLHDKRDRFRVEVATG
jgi:hypothetical protein